MFGVDTSELILVAVLALIFIGPKDLPGIDDLKAAGLLDPLDQGVFEALGQLQLESEEEDD